jgi:hypothetical protein
MISAIRLTMSRLEACPVHVVLCEIHPDSGALEKLVQITNLFCRLSQVSVSRKEKKKLKSYNAQISSAFLDVLLNSDVIQPNEKKAEILSMRIGVKAVRCTGMQIPQPGKRNLGLDHAEKFQPFLRGSRVGRQRDHRSWAGRG